MNNSRAISEDRVIAEENLNTMEVVEVSQIEIEVDISSNEAKTPNNSTNKRKTSSPINPPLPKKVK